MYSTAFPIDAKCGRHQPFCTQAMLAPISVTRTSTVNTIVSVPVQWASEPSPVRLVFAQLHGPVAVHQALAQPLRLFKNTILRIR